MRVKKSFIVLTVALLWGLFLQAQEQVNLTVDATKHYVPDWVEPTTSTAPSARADTRLVYDAATHSTVLFGGDNGGEVPRIRYDDTWIWRNGWTQLSPATSPSARGGAGMAYDPTTGTVVLFGGNDINGNALDDTWTWDGITWTQQSPPLSPPARIGQTMSYDPNQRRALMFGGNNGAGGLFSDTWVWNGSARTWTQLFPATSPVARTGAAMAYDALTKTVVLFGGSNGAGDCCNIYYGDTWTWNGTTWTQQFPATSPSPRNVPAMAYDASLGLAILIGGYSTPGQGLSGTWAWNGTTWTELNLADQPSARFGTAPDFDPLNDGLVLFGGELTGDPFANDTWLLIPVPVP
jgi:hypothetical protein